MGMFFLKWDDGWKEGGMMQKYQDVEDYRFKGRNTYHYIGDLVFYNRKEYLIHKIDKTTRQATLVQVNNKGDSNWVKMSFEAISDLPRLTSVTEGN